MTSKRRRGSDNWCPVFRLPTWLGQLVPSIQTTDVARPIGAQYSDCRRFSMFFQLHFRRQTSVELQILYCIAAGRGPADVIRRSDPVKWKRSLFSEIRHRWQNVSFLNMFWLARWKQSCIHSRFWSNWNSIEQTNKNNEFVNHAVLTEPFVYCIIIITISKPCKYGRVRINHINSQIKEHSFLSIKNKQQSTVSDIMPTGR